MTQAEDRRCRAENIVRILEDFVDTLISARQEAFPSPAVPQVLAEHRENLTQEIERMLL